MACQAFIHHAAAAAAAAAAGAADIEEKTKEEIYQKIYDTKDMMRVRMKAWCKDTQ